MYVAIDRKPEIGREIQNTACGRSGIMLRLGVMTSAEHQRATGTDNDDGLPHGATFLKRLVAPWAGTQRVVRADAYFASVAAANQLLTMGLRFIRVVKTETRGYPMEALSTLEVDTLGDNDTYRGFQKFTIRLAIPPRNKVNQSTSFLGIMASSCFFLRLT